MNTKYLVASHGRLASGIQSSINILTNQGEKIKVIDAYIDDSDYTEAVEAFIQSIEADEYGVVFTDLYGGSVNQRITSAVVSSGKQNQITIVTNANLAIVLTVMMMADAPTPENIQPLVSEAQIQIVETQMNEADDDDFFA
ncbi:PTS mannose transporter subunit IIA [Atopobacter phocae]|uniref:PTS sugar transporter subunit IIA domain-containing protein n=1 Tax=Atopobacter phocae TaxID=136492 RepID=UPI00046F6A56|nr:PTS mannose transporter subunit IIA [Atopobacter phocae]